MRQNTDRLRSTRAQLRRRLTPERPPQEMSEAGELPKNMAGTLAGTEAGRSPRSHKEGLADPD